MKPWRKLGVVETIYEEEAYVDDAGGDNSTNSPSLLSSPPSPLHSRVESWSSAMGCKTDVLIHVQGTAFYLHKDPLSSRSTYLRRKLTEQSELTLSPPLNIKAETFSLVVDFCYGAHLLVTPFNVASLLVAAVLLGMTETKGEGDSNLKQMSESYFHRFIAVNGEYAAIVFRSCLTLLPEAETMAFLVSRCVEVMDLTEDGNGIDGYFDDIICLRAEEFKIVAESMQQRFEYHDLLYRIVDFYLEEQNEKITEEQKMQICNSIDCNKLSPQLLLHAVQNPRMPLRFIVQAMLVEQLNTRRSIFSVADHQLSRMHRPRTNNSHDDNNVTLGEILHRDATKRETVQLKAAMNATSSRIQTLEKQLLCMKKILEESDENVIEGMSRDVMESGRSASFHYGSGSRIERAYPSSASCRFSGGPKERAFGCSPLDDSARMKKNIGQRLIRGLKSALRISNTNNKKSSAISENGMVKAQVENRIPDYSQC